MTLPPALPPSDLDELSVGPMDLFDQLRAVFEPVRAKRKAEFYILRELAALGRFLVTEIRKATPKASGKLAKSTIFRINEVRTTADELFYRLEFIQTALANPRARIGFQYPYMYTVHHGMQPAGRLTRAHPPFENLIPWVKVRFGGSESQVKRKAKAVAYNIYLKGIEPNTYLSDVVKRNERRIQQSADKIASDIVIDLERLPQFGATRPPRADR